MNKPPGNTKDIAFVNLEQSHKGGSKAMSSNELKNTFHTNGAVRGAENGLSSKSNPVCNEPTINTYVVDQQKLPLILETLSIQLQMVAQKRDELLKRVEKSGERSESNGKTELE